ncbi:TadE/TadG family type IV pilus assembly protein [Actinokineospora sp. NBRC 105648]|uniref:TadE/TadG family type IV pilus assembly protein n=1 Tax=Actinokineospora sp. NBRC 105648 TaxID=3032206 RepID=UPI0024A3CCB3|nr:TadE/TadG family type IV pilus assembly protein [Actinokineospora sp. NBRC 105648]GLZ37876.1 membrane protein [Actinokineospora sp. NBRC 105648]
MKASAPLRWRTSTPAVGQVGSLVRDERGSATVELVIIAPLLIAMLLFVVFCGRMASTSQQITDAAHQAARAASLARTPAAAASDARSTAQTALANAGVTCQSLAVNVDTLGLQPGSTVTVTITCTVGLSDLSLLGLPGSTDLRDSFSSVVDVHRGGPPIVAEGQVP